MHSSVVARSSVDSPPEAVPDQCWHVARVVQVGVGQQNCVNGCRGYGKGAQLRTRMRLDPWNNPQSI